MLAHGARSAGRPRDPRPCLGALVPHTVAWNSCSRWRQSECMCQNLSCWFTPLSNSFDFFPRCLAIKEFFSKPKYNHILKPEDCLSEPCTILQLGRRTVQIADLEVRAPEAKWAAHVPDSVRINRLRNLAFDFPRVLSFLCSDFVFLHYFFTDLFNIISHFYIYV